MGYTTYFSGSLQLEPTLTADQRNYLNAFCSIRHMKRDNAKLEAIPDPFRVAVGLPFGEDGEYYVGSYQEDKFGQKSDPSIIDYNKHPGELITEGSNWIADYEATNKRIEAGEITCGLWCGWELSIHENELKAVEGKNYNYIQWLNYLNERFFKPWGVVLNGSVNWSGEDMGDTGTITVTDGVIATGSQQETKSAAESAREVLLYFRTATDWTPEFETVLQDLNKALGL